MVFADVVNQSDFPWTMVGEVRLSKRPGRSLHGDDSYGSVQPIAPNNCSRLPLSLGSKVIWNEVRYGAACKNPDHSAL